MNKNKICLVTTSLKEFWDINCKIIFLNEGCKINLTNKEIEQLDFENLNFIFDSPTSVKEGINYCNKLYNSFLPIITKELNKIHGINKTEHYYHLILGNWLIHFIHVLYDKYLSLENAKKKLFKPVNYYFR